VGANRKPKQTLSAGNVANRKGYNTVNAKKRLYTGEHDLGVASPYAVEVVVTNNE